MIDRTHPLPITRQAEALGMARSTVYTLPRPISDRDLDLMKRIDRLHLEMPYAGSRMLRDLLAQDGIKIGRRHVATLMKRMGIEALYRKPQTTKKHPQHRVYPYLLRGLTINRPNQVFAMDITYIPMARGFVYLVAVLDWYSRKVLSWRVSITMDVHFCLEALEEAIDVQWRARDREHRPGLSVYLAGVHRLAQRSRHPHQHGRQRRLARQCVH